MTPKRKPSLAKRLKLAEARADDAQRQFNEEREETQWLRRSSDEIMKGLEIVHYACGMNMQAYTQADEALKLQADKVNQLETDLAHSDAERRQLERDNEWKDGELKRQQEQLRIYAPFYRVLANFPAKGSGA